MLGHRERPYNYALFFVKETVFSRFSIQSFRNVEWWTLCARPSRLLSLVSHFLFTPSLHYFCLTTPVSLTFEKRAVVLQSNLESNLGLDNHHELAI